MLEMTFRGLGIWDLEIMTRVGVRKLGEIDGRIREQLSNGLGPAPAAPAHGPGTEGAGIRVSQATSFFNFFLILSWSM